MATEEATNPAADDDARVASGEGVADEAATAQGDQDTGDQDPKEPAEGDEDNPAAEEAEIELDGQKYRVPKKLEDAFLRQADYTRKTQEIAEQKRTVEAERTALAERAEATKALAKDYGRVHALEQQIEYYGKVDWDAAQDTDPDLATREWRKYQLAQSELTTARTELQSKEDQRLKDQQADTAKALQETGKVLARDIPGWSPALATKLVETGLHYGLSHEDLAGETDPRAWKLLHAAHQWRQHETKQAAGQRQAQAQSTAPIRTLGTKAPPPTALSDKASTDAWMKARNEQTRKRA